MRRTAHNVDRTGDASTRQLLRGRRRAVERADATGGAEVVAGTRCARALRATVDSRRHRRRHRADGPAHPGRHRVCPGVGSPACHGALRHDRAAGGVRPRRTVEDPGPRPRLVAGSDHRGIDSAAGGRRPRSSGGARRVARDPDGRIPADRFGLSTRLRHRSAVEADPNRLPQRRRAGGDRGAAPGAVRVLGVGRHPVRRRSRVRRRADRRSRRPDGRCDRSRVGFA